MGVAVWLLVVIWALAAHPVGAIWAVAVAHLAVIWALPARSQRGEHLTDVKPSEFLWCLIRVQP